MNDLSSYAKLQQSFYTRPDVVQIARELLGKYLFTNIEGIITAGKIVETEAYNGRSDKACHAYHRRTPRTETMYRTGGIAYVYLCYGIHHLFNIVTNEEGLADAVLIRGVEPVINVNEMCQRRGQEFPNRKLTAGPGVLAQALGIKRAMDGLSLLGDQVWVSERTSDHQSVDITTDRRIGVDYAGDDALLPWRFYLTGNMYVSVVRK